MKQHPIPDSIEAWESGELGRDIAHAKRAPQEISQQIDDDFGLQMISIRLPKDLIQDFKIIAQFHGIGYQPLMRDALKRFAQSEFKEIAIQHANEKSERESQEKMQAKNASGTAKTTRTVSAEHTDAGKREKQKAA